MELVNSFKLLLFVTVTLFMKTACNQLHITSVFDVVA